MEETREQLLGRLRSERYGPMQRSFEWERASVLLELFRIAGECCVTPDEMNGLAILRYGHELADLTTDQLHVELSALKVLRVKLDHPANIETIYDRVPHTRVRVS